MRHFLFFLAAVFVIVFLAHVNRGTAPSEVSGKPVLRVFGYGSFVSRWGPGPELKKLFETTCNCLVEFIEGSDSGILLQRLRIEGESLGADVVVGLDQYDISRATAELEWHEISVNGVEFDPAVRDFANMKFFVPYDWGPLAFMMRKGSLVEPASLDDLLKPEYRGQIALQDPRTSSPGLQFLNWVMRVKGPIDGEKFLRSLLGSVHSISPSWSTSIGLYNQKKASIVFTYATSPLYYLIEENSRDHTALRFTEPHPVQIELVGIPKFCRECDLAESFVTFLLSPEGQSIIMKKNYMLPVVPSVRAGTSFQDIFVGVPTLPVEVPTNSEVNDVLKRWSVILRESGS